MSRMRRPVSTASARAMWEKLTAGFDPFGASRFLTDMQRNAELKAAGSDPRSLDFLSSHPATPERVMLAAHAIRKSAL